MTFSMSTAKEKGVQLYSGESVTTFRNLLSNIDTTPAEAMEQIIESERYACVRTGMWKKRCKVVIGKQDVGE